MKNGLTEAQLGQLSLIKKALIDRKEYLEREYSLTLNLNKMAKKLRTTKPTLESLFIETDHRQPSLFLLMDVCKMMGLRLSDILPGDAGIPQIDHSIFYGIQGNKPGEEPLQNTFYEGDYHCYYFRPTSMEERVTASITELDAQTLLHAVISLKWNPERKQMLATFSEREEKSNFENTRKMHELKLSGEAQLLIHMNQILIDLSDDTGLRQMFIMFPYISLAKDVLYYKTAAMFNVSTDSRVPLFQKIGFFREELDLKDADNEKILRGILALSNRSAFLVRKDRLDQLAQADSNVNSFVQDGIPSDTYYLINEKESYARRTEMTFDEKSRVLMQLRSISTADPIYPVQDHERFNVFAKRFQKENTVRQK